MASGAGHPYGSSLATLELNRTDGSRAMLEVSILTSDKDTLPNMPGLKWTLFPALAKGENSVKLVPEAAGAKEKRKKEGSAKRKTMRTGGLRKHAMLRVPSTLASWNLVIMGAD